MERKVKAIPNRTIGLQTKTIADATATGPCQCCDGKGKYTIRIESKSIRNLKGTLGFVNLEQDCPQCENGVVKQNIRVIRKNKISAII